MNWYHLIYTVLWPDNWPMTVKATAMLLIVWPIFRVRGM